MTKATKENLIERFQFTSTIHRNTIVSSIKNQMRTVMIFFSVNNNDWDSNKWCGLITLCTWQGLKFLLP